MCLFAEKVGNIDRSVVRSLKMMTVNREQDREPAIFAPLWGGPANVAALEKNLKHRWGEKGILYCVVLV